MNEQLKEEAREQLELNHSENCRTAFDEYCSCSIESTVFFLMEKSIDSERKRCIEIIYQWFTKAPKYRTKESLIKELKGEL